MGKKVLADWLKEDYKMEGIFIKPKKTLTYKIKGETKEIPENALWVKGFGQKDNPDKIVSVTVCLKHTHCLQLAKEYNEIVQLEKVKREVFRWPFEGNVLWGYMTITGPDGSFADGEVHVKNLMPVMHGFACTMMQKRAEDRYILRKLGLYEQGFYSQEELMGVDQENVDIDDVITKSDNVIEAKKKPEVDVKEKVLLDLKTEINKIFEEKKIKDPTFDWKVWAKTLITIDPVDDRFSNYTLKEWKTIYNVLLEQKSVEEKIKDESLIEDIPPPIEGEK